MTNTTGSGRWTDIAFRVLLTAGTPAALFITFLWALAHVVSPAAGMMSAIASGLGVAFIISHLSIEKARDSATGHWFAAERSTAVPATFLSAYGTQLSNPLFGWMGVAVMMIIAAHWGFVAAAWDTEDTHESVSPEEE